MGGPEEECQEYSQHGLQDVPGSRDTVGGSIREEDDGGETNIPVTKERAGTVRGMREGDGGRVFGVPQNDTAWEGNSGAIDLGSLSHGRRTADVSVSLPDQGRAAKMPSGGLPRMGRDKDGDADALLQLACPGYCDHLGGGKPHPPKVITMRHYGAMEGIKR